VETSPDSHILPIFKNRKRYFLRKSEIYEKMNQQSISIIKTMNTAKKDTKLSEEIDKILQKFQAHYSGKNLPAEFLQRP